MRRVEVTKLQTLTGHKDCIYTLEKAGDAAKFFSGAGDGLVVSWDLKEPGEGQLVAKVPASVYALHYHQPRNLLIIGQNYQGIHLIDVASKKEIGSLKITDSAIFDIKVFENNIWIAAGDGTLTVVGMDSLFIKKRLMFSNKSARAMAINTEKKHLAVGYSDHNIRIISLENFEVIKTIAAHKNSVFTVNYAKDFKYLLSGSRDAHLKVWDPDQNYKQENAIVAHLYAINHVEFSPDGKYFVTCSMDKSIKVWDAKAFQLLKVIDRARHAGHGTSINKLLWTHHKQQVVSCSDDRSISVWRLDFIENI